MAYTASVALHYQTGARYRFGAVQFEPGSGLDPELLARYVPFAPGEPFDAEQLIELRRGLVNSDYFQQIEMTPRRDLAIDNEVPIVVKLVPRPPNKYTLGLGYGTDTGVRGKAGWERRQLNEAGHRLVTELNVSQVRSDLTASYLIPVRDPRTDQLSFNVGAIDEYPDTSDSERYTAGVAYTHAGGRWSLAEGRIAGWRSTYGLSYEHETLGDRQREWATTLLMPNASWLYLVTDSRFVSTRGWRAQLDVRGSSTALSSDVTFGQARAQTKVIQPLGTRGRVVARLDVGATWIDDFSTLPSSLRFYAGGDQSVRGYAYNSLGPKDENGDVIGGPYLLVGSVEYEHRILEKWSLATFFDSGNAVDSFDGPYYNGAGVGVHWRSPIGLIRLDVAWRAHARRPAVARTLRYRARTVKRRLLIIAAVARRRHARADGAAHERGRSAVGVRTRRRARPGGVAGASAARRPARPDPRARRCVSRRAHRAAHRRARARLATRRAAARDLAHHAPRSRRCATAPAQPAGECRARTTAMRCHSPWSWTPSGSRTPPLPSTRQIR